MELKKFYANDMGEALAQIKSELGSDAVIISSKYVRSKKGIFGMFSKRMIEVVASFEKPSGPPKGKTVLPDASKLTAFSREMAKASAEAPAVPEPPVTPAATVIPTEPITPIMTGPPAISLTPATPAQPVEPVIPTQPAEPVIPTPLEKELVGEIAELRRMIEEVSYRVADNSGSTTAGFTRTMLAIYNKLVSRDVDPQLACDLCNEAQAIAEKKRISINIVIQTLLTDMLGSPAMPNPSRFNRHVVMFLGPTGVGKTTTLVKIASDFMMNKGKKVAMINADVYRVAAQAHLQAYCDILGAPMKTIYRPEDLEEALKSLSDADMVFIDTMGNSSRDEDYKRQMEFLSGCDSVNDVFLVVSASTSLKVLKETIKNYAYLKKHSLIVTKLDEVEDRGVLINMAHEAKRPIAYLTTGQNVPDDLEPFDPEAVVSELLR